VRSTATVSDVLRRGIDSVLANWPLLLMRIAESIVVAALAIAAALAVIVPILVSIGLSKFEDFQHIDDPADLVRNIFLNHWLVLVYVLIGITALLFVFLALHAFVEGGAAEILVSAERQAGDEPVNERRRLEAFSMDRWLRGGARMWWPIFWIYNATWGLGGLIMLVPLVLIAALMLLSRGNPAAIAIGCFGLLATFFIVMIVGIVVGLWTEKAIVVLAARNDGTASALSDGWRELRADLGRHFGAAFVIIVIAIGAAGVMVMFSAALGFTRSAGAQILFLPVRLGISLVNTFVSAAIGNWLLASFAALTVRRSDNHIL
jgi:hypothetical protein